MIFFNWICIKPSYKRIRKSNEQGKVSNKGWDEQRVGISYVYSVKRMSVCKFEPPQRLLDATTMLMRFYPLFLGASRLLQRLVQ